jgi:hypothetical protein
MKRLKLFLVVTMLFGIVACSNEENLNDSRLNANSEIEFTDAELDVLYRMRDENNKVGIEEATQFANDVIGFLDGESAVKSGTARSISSIGALVSTDMQSSSYSGGHAWVIDGYINQRQTITTTVELTLRGRVTGRSTSTTYNYRNYLHNNWGWSGNDNGYFVSGSFDANHVDLPSNTRSGEEHNYQYEIKIYPNITR